MGHHLLARHSANVAYVTNPAESCEDVKQKMGVSVGPSAMSQSHLHSVAKEFRMITCIVFFLCDVKP